MTISNFIIQPFYSISTNMPLGACWVAEDVDGNQAQVYLRTVEKCHNIYAYRLVLWDGTVHLEGETTSIAKAWRCMEKYLRVNPGDGKMPELQRVANWYSGRMDK